MAATGIPTVIVVGAVTGWSRTAIGVPTWVSWTLVVPITAVGVLAAWASTPFGREGTTNTLLKAYRRDGIEVAEKQYWLSRMSPERAGAQWFNVALALEREGDDEAAEAVYRHAAERGFPPAMFNLANRIRQRGEEAEAQALYRRASEAGSKQSDYR